MDSCNTGLAIWWIRSLHLGLYTSQIVCDLYGGGNECEWQNLEGEFVFLYTVQRMLALVDSFVWPCACHTLACFVSLARVHFRCPGSIKCIS